MLNSYIESAVRESSSPCGQKDTLNKSAIYYTMKCMNEGTISNLNFYIMILFITKDKIYLASTLNRNEA